MAGTHRERLILGIVETDTTFERALVRGESLWVGRCLFCQAKLVVALSGEAPPGVTVEHIVPRNHGGTDALENLALACSRCNGEKGRRHDHRGRGDARRIEITAALLERRRARWPEGRPAAFGEAAGRAPAPDLEGDGPRVSALFIYPLKSARGIPVASATVGDRGFEHDRRFMVVDPAGRFLTQREVPGLSLVEVAIDGHALVLGGEGGVRVPLRPAGGPARRVRVWRDEVEALSLGAQAAGFLADRLGREAELVYMPPGAGRPVDPAYARRGEQVSFADGFPYLLIGEGSLDDLNARLESPVEMERFRPNLVVRGAPAFAEDSWQALAIGTERFRLVKPCDRCVIPTLDPATGRRGRGREPLRTLAGYRKQAGAVLFGQNALHEGPRGEVRVGDRVTPIG